MSGLAGTDWESVPTREAAVRRIIDAIYDQPLTHRVTAVRVWEFSTAQGGWGWNVEWLERLGSEPQRDQPEHEREQMIEALIRGKDEWGL